MNIPNACQKDRRHYDRLARRCRDRVELTGGAEEAQVLALMRQVDMRPQPIGRQPSTARRPEAEPEAGRPTASEDTAWSVGASTSVARLRLVALGECPGSTHETVF